MSAWSQGRKARGKPDPSRCPWCRERHQHDHDLTRPDGTVVHLTFVPPKLKEVAE